MSNRYFHGTTEENLKILLSGGDEPKSCWKVSDRDELLYVYDAQKFVNQRECDSINESDLIINRAFEQAQMQAAIKGISQKLYVLELNLSDIEVMDDLSCEGMSYLASCIHSEHFHHSMIVNIYECEFSHWHSPFVLSGLIDRVLFDSEDIDSKLIILVKALISQSTYLEPEDLFYFDYKECDISKIIEQCVPVFA